MSPDLGFVIPVPAVDRRRLLLQQTSSFQQELLQDNVTLLPKGLESLNRVQFQAHSPWNFFIMS